MITYDRSTDVTPAVISDCIQNRNQKVTLQLNDGPLIIEKKWLLFNLILWRPLVRRQLPITIDYVYRDEAIIENAIQRIQDRINTTITSAIVGPRSKIVKPLLYELANDRNDIYNIAARDLANYVRTISAVGMAKTLNHPKVAEACKFDITAELQVGIDAVERKIDRTYAKVLDACMDRTIPDNVFYPFLRLDIVSRQQLVQNICCAGTRTDVNDLMVSMPILSPYFRGLKSIVEFAIDGLSAKKSAYYNAFGMPKAQYPNRKQQLLASSMCRLYRGDCGTTHLMPFHVHERNYRYIVGKYHHVNGDMGTPLAVVTKQNCKDLIGQTIYMRSPMLCRHTDGACDVCIGELAKYKHDNEIIGFAAVIALMEVIGQLILSNKHLSRTSSISYRLPVELDPFMQVLRNDVYLHPNIKPEELTLVIPYGTLQLDDLVYISDRGTFNDQLFSSIPVMSVMHSSTGELLAQMAQMCIKGAREVPYFTGQFLMHVRNNPTCAKVVGDSIHLSLKGFDVTKPIMRCIISNDSMIRFSNDVEQYFGTKIARETSAPAVLQFFSDYVYRKIGTNLAHLEIALRASMVTSSTDFSIPVVTDPNNVSFGALGHTIPNRSIGAQLAYERFPTYIMNPRTYILPRGVGVMDASVGFLD